MKKTNVLLFLIILLFILVSFYVGYRYGYQKGIKRSAEKKKIESTLPVKKVTVRPEKVKEKKKEEELYLLSCEEAYQNLLSFFSYLEQKDYVKRYLKEKDIKSWISTIIKKLSQNPPHPEGEGINPDVMIDNIYHLFRTLSPRDIKIIKKIIKEEADQLEYLMRWYYILLISQKKNQSYDFIPSLRTAYIYSAFFINTIGGRAYLFRRSVLLRLLLSYYCVLIIHNMDKKGENIYGIDIYPVAKEIKEELKRFPELKFNQYYTEELNKILRKI